MINSLEITEEEQAIYDKGKDIMGSSVLIEWLDSDNEHLDNMRPFDVMKTDPCRIMSLLCLMQESGRNG